MHVSTAAITPIDTQDADQPLERVDELDDLFAGDHSESD